MNYILQVDSDLIFDSIEDTNNNVYSHDRHKRDLTTSIEEEEKRESKSSHVEEDQQYWFSGALHRIRRHIGSIFSSGEPEEQKHKKRRTRQDEDPLEQEQDAEYEDDNNVSKILLKICICGFIENMLATNQSI